MFVYRWEDTASLLPKFRDHDGSHYEGITIEYVNPVTGGPVYKTMGSSRRCCGRRAAAAGAPERQPDRTMFRGRGHSIVGGHRFDWEPFDTFCIPGGTGASM